MSITGATSAFQVTIVSGASASTVLELVRSAPKRLLLPDTLQGTHLIFKVGARSDRLLTAYDDSGTLIAIPFTQGTSVELNPLLFDGARYFQVQTCSASNGTAQTQGADRTFQIVVV